MPHILEIQHLCGGWVGSNVMVTTFDTADLQERALSLGLADLGVCRAEGYTSTERDIALRSAAGLFADLKFTMAQPEVSCHPETLLPDAQSVISCALGYWLPDDVTATDDVPRGRIARHARWDHYTALRERLAEIAAYIQQHGWHARVLVDENDHVDREAAMRSGVGFYGKNTLMITRRSGSWVVLGTIITDAPLTPTHPVRAGCGSCTACIDACPTDAISADGGVLDVNSCLSYWTQSKHVVPEPVRERMGDWVYGCDICQEVCPWNRGIEKRSADAPALPGHVDLVDWLQADGRELVGRYPQFFIPRRKARFLRRNALIALGNGGREADVPVIAAFLDAQDELLRDHAAWALRAIGGRVAEAALRSAKKWRSG